MLFHHCDQHTDMASSSTATTFTIVNLQDLNAFTEAAFTANYLHNLTTIFNFVPEDVPTVLTPRTFNTLKGLRKDLLTMVASTSLDLSTKTALTRRNKEDVINDILLLSEFLVKPEHSIDLSSIYTPSVSDVNIIDTSECTKNPRTGLSEIGWLHWKLISPQHHKIPQ